MRRPRVGDVDLHEAELVPLAFTCSAPWDVVIVPYSHILSALFSWDCLGVSMSLLLA